MVLALPAWLVMVNPPASGPRPDTLPRRTWKPCEELPPLAEAGREIMAPPRPAAPAAARTDIALRLERIGNPRGGRSAQVRSFQTLVPRISPLRGGCYTLAASNPAGELRQKVGFEAVQAVMVGDLSPFRGADVEGVNHLVAEGRDLGRDHVQLVLGQGAGDAVQHADGVGGPDLHDGRPGGRLLVE